MFYSIDMNQVYIGIVLVAIVALMIIFPIFSNKKRAKAVNDLHSTLKAGDKIMTIGGVIGTVIEVRRVSPVDTEIVLETGIEGRETTLVMDIKALYQVIPPMTAPYQAPDATEVFPETESVEEVTAPDEKDGGKE